MKTILFSPVGGTDPISQTNCYDGSMLHICRHRKPDVVYLYLSAEMDKHEDDENDKRYTRAIELLEEKIGHHFEIRLIRRPELNNPHDFNIFFKDFRDVIKNIVAESDQDDRLLVNISSGTPGMKSALNVMAALGEFKCTCIQVTTPEKKLQNHEHTNDFELKTLWDLDPDNDEGAEDRSSDVECPNLLLIKGEQTIKSFLMKYDYHAAYNMALDLSKNYPQSRVSQYIDYLEFAMNRAAFKNVDSYLKRFPELKPLFPIEGADRPVFEYALLCDLKWKRGELSDFIRSLSPLIQELFIRVTNKNIYPVSLEMIAENKGHETWNRKKMQAIAEENITGKKIYDALKNAYDDFESAKNDPYVTSENFCEIINKVSTVSELKDDINILRNQIEKKIRNILAHKIFYVDETWIKKETGNLSPQQIMKLLKKVFRYTSINVRDEYWAVYDEMNKFIMSKIDAR